jgi:catechol 2,3-dioxygenase-like lactoylglutathione lyase family enzyme
MIGKGIFHTNIVVRDLERSLRFYTGLFGMEKTDFIKDGDLVFLTTPGRNDILTLNPSGHSYGFPEGYARESERELKENLPGVQGRLSLCLPKSLSGMTRARSYGNGSGRWLRF